MNPLQVYLHNLSLSEAATSALYSFCLLTRAQAWRWKVMVWPDALVFVHGTPCAHVPLLRIRNLLGKFLGDSYFDAHHFAQGWPTVKSHQQVVVDETQMVEIEAAPRLQVMPVTGVRLLSTRYPTPLEPDRPLFLSCEPVRSYLAFEQEREALLWLRTSAPDWECPLGDHAARLWERWKRHRWNEQQRLWLAAGVCLQERDRTITLDHMTEAIKVQAALGQEKITSQLWLTGTDQIVQCLLDAGPRGFPDSFLRKRASPQALKPALARLLKAGIVTRRKGYRYGIVWTLAAHFFTFKEEDPCATSSSPIKSI